MKWREEHDSMGPVRVPADARWGASTQRAVENFPISGSPMPGSLIRAVALIKAEAARTNGRLRAVPQVDARVARAVAEVADEIAHGAFADQFPIDVFQTGSGTSTNMNVNEVVAHLASERSGIAIHPNDHVNASQSSNDVIPSAIRIAALDALAAGLDPALARLQRALAANARRLRDVVKAGRTHLMDATPVTLGQEFGGYAALIAEGRERLDGCRARVGALPLGGTAVGTGINAPRGFARSTVRQLAARTGLPLREAENHFAVHASHDALAELSAHLRTVAGSLTKIANDLRWMASGPTAGLAEITLPALQPGSSIMPGKVNPVIPEVVTQVAAQVYGNDAVVAFAASQGAFELNTYLPVIARNLLESLALLTAAATVFAPAIAGIEADEARCRAYAESSPALATALAPAIGYEAAAALVTEGRGGDIDVDALTRGGMYAPPDGRRS